MRLQLVGKPLKPLFGICDFAVFDAAQGGVGNADGFGQLLKRQAAALRPLPYVGGSWRRERAIRRCATGHVIPYVVAQVVAAIVAAAVLWVIASSHAGWVPGGFASNGYGDLSPAKYGLGGCFLMEVVMTFFFLFIIIGTTSRGAAIGFAGIPIGLALTLIHLVSIPVTNTSVNPARSTGPALFAGAFLGGVAVIGFALLKRHCLTR